jgi:isocitrate dehydrogenase
VANGLKTLGVRENNDALLQYSKQLKAALINTVASGTITGDLKGKTTDPNSETLVDMQGFLDAVEANIVH